MDCSDYNAVTYNHEVYCTECLPEGIDDESEGVDPIFAGSEWDYVPCCCKCDCKHDYMTILKEDMQEQQSKQGQSGMEQFMNLNVPDSNRAQNACCDEYRTHHGCHHRCDSCLFSPENREQFAQWLQQRAAAPDLLAACKLTLANLAPMYSEDHLCITTLKAAIAKAEATS